MEIAPRARRRAWTGRAVTMLAFVVLTPVTVLALIPAVFGLERYVAAEEAGTGAADRGSLMFQRVVPISDLEAGDVVSYPAPESQDGRTITRQVVEVGQGFVRTQADGSTLPDAGLLWQRDFPTISRLVLTVPYLGYPFLLTESRTMWIITLLIAGGLLALIFTRDLHCARRRCPKRRVETLV